MSFYQLSAYECVVGWGAAMVTYELVFPYALVLSGLGLVFLAAFS